MLGVAGARPSARCKGVVHMSEARACTVKATRQKKYQQRGALDRARAERLEQERKSEGKKGETFSRE